MTTIPFPRHNPRLNGAGHTLASLSLADTQRFGNPVVIQATGSLEDFSQLVNLGVGDFTFTLFRYGDGSFALTAQPLAAPEPHERPDDDIEPNSEQHS